MTDLSDPRVPGGGAGKKVTLGGTTTSSGESAGLVVAAEQAAADKYYPTEIQPDHYSSHDVSTVTTGKNSVVITGAADNQRLLVSVNGGDDATDAQRLLNGQPNVIPMAIDISDQIEVQAAGINRIAICLETASTETIAGGLAVDASTPTLLLDGTAAQSFHVFTFASATNAVIDCQKTAIANEIIVTVRGVA